VDILTAYLAIPILCEIATEKMYLKTSITLENGFKNQLTFAYLL
jgi:hypothetical protein